MLGQNAIHSRIGITLPWRMNWHMTSRAVVSPLSSIEADINGCGKKRCHRRRPDGSSHRLSARAAGHAIGVGEPARNSATLSKRLRVTPIFFVRIPRCLKRSAHDRLAPAVTGEVSFSKQRQRNCPLNRKSLPSSKVQSRRIRSWQAIHRQFRPPRSGVISNIVSVSSARIFAIRRTSSRSWK